MTLEEQKLNTFETYLDARLPQMKRDYVRAVNRDLTQQNWAGTFGRNIEGVFETQLQQFSKELDALALTPELQVRALELLLDFSRVFVQSALQHNRTTCALSNFASEHQPEAQYIKDVIAKTERSVANLFA